MKRLIAVVTGALVAAGLTVAPEPQAAQGLPIGGYPSAPDWSMNLWVDGGTSWSSLFNMNFLACQDVPLKLTVSVAADAAWSLAGQVTAAGSTTILASFEKSGVGPLVDPPVLVPGVSLCAHFGGPVTPPDHMYVATGTASVAGSPSPTAPFEVPFRIEPMRSSVFASRHEIRGGVSAFIGQVTVFTSDGFRRPAPVGTVTLERLEGSSWVKAGETVSASDGNFTVLAGTILPTGSYVRVLYPGDYWVAASPSMPSEVFPPYVTPAPWSPPPPAAPAALPVPTVKSKAVSNRSKLKVDVNPDRGSKFYVFQVQRKKADGSWKAVKSYETRGATEKRTLNLRKGTYRVWVRPGYGFAEAMSPNEVTLKR